MLWVVSAHGIIRESPITVRRYSHWLTNAADEYDTAYLPSPRERTLYELMSTSVLKYRGTPDEDTRRA